LQQQHLAMPVLMATDQSLQTLHQQQYQSTRHVQVLLLLIGLQHFWPVLLLLLLGCCHALLLYCQAAARAAAC
jgi:hypothetical protein